MKTTQERIDELKQKINELEESLKKEEFDYPLCRESIDGELVILFDGLSSGKVLFDTSGFFDIGEYGDYWIEHTNTNVWKPRPYNKERGLYHKQIVYCWNKFFSHSVHVKFYDAINDCTFYQNGELNGFEYDNYSATMPEHMITAHKTLED